MNGAPSSIKCRAGGSRVGFTITISPPTGTPGSGKPRAHSAVALAKANCVDASAPGKIVPALAAPHDTFELRTYGAVPPIFGQAVQRLLVSHNVVGRLNDGLGARPRGYPQARAPIYLNAGEPRGMTNVFCDGSPRDASTVPVDGGVRDTAATVAHELFHVYSGGLATPSSAFWIEDAGSEWAVWRAGLLEEPSYPEIFLQFPNVAADTMVPDGYRYGMWRFIQFLDDRGLVVEGASWPILRAAVAAEPAMVQAMDQFLRARGTSFGEELARFWGEHLKEKPPRPPTLRPTGKNSTVLTVDPGNSDVKTFARGIHTSLTDFKVAAGVRRVEFEFEPPPNTHYWGLYEANGSKRFNFGDTISFCVGGGDDDDLGWPGHFPVTFTNGSLLPSAVEGKIKVFAQTQTDQCKAAPTNRACRVLKAAGAEALFGPPALHGFAGHTGTRKGRPYASCSYGGRIGVATLDLERWRSSKQLRAFIKSEERVPGARRVDLGDGATMVAPNPNAVGIHVAVGRQKLAVVVAADAGGTSKSLQLAENAVPLVR